MTGIQLQLAGNTANNRDYHADKNRERLDTLGVWSINLIGSPGAGKTQLILRTIQGLSRQLRIGVIEGDMTSVALDSEQVSALGRPVTQVSTGGGALDAVMLGSALAKLPLNDLDLVIVENVGGLTLPGSPRLGTHANVLVASVPEGDDKPYKYPAIYRSADVVIVNKTDLLPSVQFDLAYFRCGVERLNPGVPLFPLSSYTGADVHRWFDWLSEQCGMGKRVSAMQQTA